MDLNINVNVGSNYGLTDSGTVTGSDQTQKTERTEYTTFSDTIEVGGLKFEFAYIAGPGYPLLLPPDDHINENTSPFLQSTQREEPPFQSEYYTSFSENLEQAAERYNLSEEQVNQLVFAHMTGSELLDPGLGKILEEVEAFVAEEMSQEFDFPSATELGLTLKEKGKSALNASMGKLGELVDYAKSLSDGPEKEKILEFVKNAMNQLQGLSHSIENFHGNRDDLEALLGEVGQGLGKIQGEIASLKSVTNDPEIAATLSNLLSGISDELEVFDGNVSNIKQTNALANGDWSSIQNETGEVFVETLNLSYGDSFEKALTEYAKANELSDEQTAQLRFAHFNPDATVDPKTASALKEVQELALSKMSEKWGIPPGYIPEVNNQRFLANIEVSYDNAFQAAVKGHDLSALAKELELTEKEVAGRLEYLHFHPEASFPGSEQLKIVVKELQLEALGNVSKELGIPEGFSIPSNSGDYDAMLEGSFMHAFHQNLKTQDPRLSSEQISNVIAALNNPLDPTISAETKNLIGKIYNQSVEQVRADYGLPDNWSPPIDALAAAVNVSPAFQQLWAQVDQMTEVLDGMTIYINQMPDSDPNKESLLNVMKIISQALAELKDQLARMQSMDAAHASKIAKAQSEATMNKVDLQQEKMDEIKKKMDDIKWINDVMKVLGPVMKVLMIAFVSTLAPPLGLILAAVLIVQEVSGNNYMKDLFTLIMDTIPPITIGDTYIPLNAIAMSVFAIATVAFAGPVLATTLATEMSFFSEVLEAFGMSQTTAMWVGMVIEIVAQVLIMIGMIVVTLGAGTIMVFEKVATSVAKATAKGLETVARGLQQAAEKLQVISKALEKIADFLNQLAQRLRDWAKNMQTAMNAFETANKEMQQLMTQGLDKSHASVQAVQSSMNAAMKEMESLMKTINTVFTNLEMLELFINAGTSTLQGVQKLTQANIAKIEAEYDSEIAELESLIKALKQILQKMFDSIKSQGQFMTEIGDLQNSMWGDLSQTATALANANTA